MKRATFLKPEFVEFIPDTVEAGILYISKRYSTATHLCCCGCGLEVVTPLNPAKWSLIERSGSVSLYPSVGNWSFPCQSHYWIKDNNVAWAGAMSTAAIAGVKARDRRDALLLAKKQTVRFARIRKFVRAAAQKMAYIFSSLWR